MLGGLVEMAFWLVTALLILSGIMAPSLGAVVPSANSFVIGLSTFLLIYGAAAPWVPARVRLPLHVITLGGLLAAASFYPEVDLGFAWPSGSWTWVLLLVAVLPVISAGVAWVRPAVVPARTARFWQARTIWRFLFELIPRLIITTVVLEEVAFRGLLFGAAHVAWDGFWHPALLSAVVFGLWHISPTVVEARGQGTAVSRSRIAMTVVVTAAFGLGLAYARDAAASLWPTIAVHFAVNATGMAAAFVASRRSTEEQPR